MFEIISIRYRKVFYVLPLFITWIFGYTWENDTGARSVAKIGYGLFLMFSAGTMGVYFITEALTVISPDLDIISSYVGMLLQSIVGTGYAALSIYISRMEYKEEHYKVPFVEKLVNAIESSVEKAFN